MGRGSAVKEQERFELEQRRVRDLRIRKAATDNPDLSDELLAERFRGGIGEVSEALARVGLIAGCSSCPMCWRQREADYCGHPAALNGRPLVVDGTANEPDVGCPLRVGPLTVELRVQEIEPEDDE